MTHSEPEHSIGACIFDMDGLLIDSESIGLETYLETCREFGLPEVPEIYIQSLGLNRVSGERFLSESLRKITEPVAFIRHWTKLFQYSQMIHPIKMMPGALDLLKFLAGRGLPLAIATSSDCEIAIQRLSSVGILDYFQHMVAGDQVEFGKPAPQIYAEAARRMKIHESRCIALEDSDNGVRAAYAAGMTVFHIPDLAPPSHGLQGAKLRVFDSLSDVMPVLQQLL